MGIRFFIFSYFFFFSSRRRHTSLVRDWSSDVCSSDLLSVAVIGGIFAWRSDHHLAALAITADAEGVAFIKAFKDVFVIGSSLGLLAALVFLAGGWRALQGGKAVERPSNEPTGAGLTPQV